MIRIALFLEDAGHLTFLRGLIDRLTEPYDGPIDVQERNAAGGSGAMLTSYLRYLRDLREKREEYADIVIPAKDGNCTSVARTTQLLQKAAERAAYPGQVVYAVPDPHVEAWYLADGRAVATIAGARTQAALPAAKCERAFYKRALRAVFADADLDPPAGGSEFGHEIAMELDLDRACRHDDSLRMFVTAMQGALRVASLN